MKAAQPHEIAHLSSLQPLTAPTIAAQDKNELITTPDQPGRRTLLQNASLLAAATALTTLVAPAVVDAQTAPDPGATPAMRSPRTTIAAANANAPELPPLAIIALNRIAFGPRPGEIDAFNALGATPEAALTAYVDQQLNPAAIDDSACDAILANYQFQTLNKPLAQLWTEHQKNPLTGEDRNAPVRETEKATLLKAVYSKRQLQEVLADFWFNHFNINGWDFWSQSVFVHYDRDVLRANMLGNFRQMLEAVAQSPAMLYYLDNQSNSGGNPNENYARELFELHTLGAENYLGVVPLSIGSNGQFEHPAPKDANGRPLLYVDEDVYGATTCFTGWRVNGDTGIFAFDSSAHFPYQKLVLGQAIPASQGIKDGRDVLDLLARHVGTARHICRKLCRRLISDTPPERVVQAAADVFMANLDAPDQLKQVTRTILLSPEFSTTWGEKIKRPLEYVVSLLRASQADFTPDSTFLWLSSQMGQRLYAWPAPNGYPDVRSSWSSTMPLLQRWRVGNWMINSWTYGGVEPNKDDPRLTFTNPPTLKKPTQIVDFWSQWLMGRILPSSERGPVVEFMAGGRNVDFDLPDDQIEERLRSMIGLIFMSPSFQWR